VVSDPLTRFCKMMTCNCRDLAVALGYYSAYIRGGRKAALIANVRSQIGNLLQETELYILELPRYLTGASFDVDQKINTIIREDILASWLNLNLEAVLPLF